MTHTLTSYTPNPDLHKMGEDWETRPETRRLLTAAEYFLERRNFDDCRKYAQRAGESDPSHPDPTRILSIATVLSARPLSPALPDFYAQFDLPRCEPNAAVICSRFEALASNLNPDANPYPHSSEAYDAVLRAWHVLSDPSEKARYDAELRGCTPGRGGGTFWTMCPYCYYVYEYDRVYEECCLRCANERCRRTMHAVEVGVPPPPEVVAQGQYSCPGFTPINALGNDNLWVPFAPRAHGNREVRRRRKHCDLKQSGLEFYEADGDDVMVGLDDFDVGKSGGTGTDM